MTVGTEEGRAEFNEVVTSWAFVADRALWGNKECVAMRRGGLVVIEGKSEPSAYN